jgi:hypothetical protein
MKQFSDAGDLTVFRCIHASPLTPPPSPPNLRFQMRRELRHLLGTIRRAQLKQAGTRCACFMQRVGAEGGQGQLLRPKIRLVRYGMTSARDACVSLF